MTESGYNIDDLVREAQTRWLKPAEVLFILQNHKEEQLTHRPLQKPASGSLFLFNKRVLRFFRKDGHNWRKKKDGRTVGEAHERLKVGYIEALNCYYAHGEQNPNFQRRSYWMLEPACDHIVLVHYRDIGEGRYTSGQSSPGSTSILNESLSAVTAQHPAPAALTTELCEQYHSPENVEVSSDAVIQSNEIDHLDRFTGMTHISSSSELEVSQALRRLEEQLNLNDNLEESRNENTNDSEIMINDQCRSAAFPGDVNHLVWQQETGGEYNHRALVQELTVECQDSLPWKEMLEFSNSSPRAESLEKNIQTSEGNGMLLPHSSGWSLQHSASSEYPSNSGSLLELSTLISMSQEVEDFKYATYSPLTNFLHTNPDHFTTPFDQGQIGMYLETDSSITISQKQKFTIQEISPEWGFSTTVTKVVIVGSFLCDPSESAWTCMFGDIEVPVQIIQEGVICCHAPPRPPGMVTLCITSGNRESCSEIREFQYRTSPSSCAQCCSYHSETTKSPEEMLLLVKFVRMLLSDHLVRKGDINECVADSLEEAIAGEDSWGHVIEALSDSSCTIPGTTDWLMEQLLKDKLQQWLSSRLLCCSQQGCSLSKKEQGVIHLVAGLGFEWALNAILKSGVIVDFRDINGWTALHWAAQFGREKVVAALIASGASAGALTDPNSQDSRGKTPASIAATGGHKGLAGYLSEVALTSHLSSLTLEENEFSQGSAVVNSEIALSSISKRNFSSNEDHVSLEDTHTAVRNAVQAAARIQAAFRLHSFRRRQERETAASSTIDEYNLLSTDKLGMSAASIPVFRNARDTNTAALSIQKKYRGWKGRKGYLAFLRKVVKIQAHVRGYQVRKQYKIICWAVGVLEKVVLRWRRKGVGLRGFQLETESIDESEEEDILKVFRKQNVEKAIDEAVTRVLSMVDSPNARQQYHRMLQVYRQAKAEKDAGNEVMTSSQNDVTYMENEDACYYQ